MARLTDDNRGFRPGTPYSYPRSTRDQPLRIPYRIERDGRPLTDAELAAAVASWDASDHFGWQE